MCNFYDLKTEVWGSFSYHSYACGTTLTDMVVNVEILVTLAYIATPSSTLGQGVFFFFINVQKSFNCEYAVILFLYSSVLLGTCQPARIHKGQRGYAENVRLMESDREECNWWHLFQGSCAVCT